MRYALTPRSHAHHFGPGRFADHFVYRCFDAEDVLLYVGCTRDVTKRMYAHRSGKSTSKASRWLSVTMSRVEVDGPHPGRDAGREAERAAIQAERPLFNYQQTAGPNQAAWMTRTPIARYLVEHGHLELALETVCVCPTEVREVGAFWDSCFSHLAAHVAGITDLPPFVEDDPEERVA